MKKLFRYLLYALIFCNVILSAWSVLHNNIVFQTDIARDFLLIENMVDNRDIALIGPKAGGIPGMFHGPLWLYVNAIPYIIGQGNPVVVGWFWFILNLLFLAITYYISRRIFDSKVALLSTTLLSLLQVGIVKQFFNPFGAVLLSPLIFYSIFLYLKDFKLRYFISALFLFGLLMHFEMAWGILILFLFIIYAAKKMYEQKKLKHLLTLPVFFVPLVTFIAFDLRHSFLLSKAVMNYLGTGKNVTLESISMRLVSRATEFYSSISLTTISIINIFVLIVFVFGFYLIYLKKKKIHFFYVLYFYFFLGFWILSLFYGGRMWPYYFWPFLPLTVIFLSSSYKFLPKYIFIVLFASILIPNVIVRYSDTFKSEVNENEWILYSTIAKEVYSDAPDEFGYYIFTPDLYAYPPRYAMHYTGKQNNKIAVPFEKRKVTYVIIAPPPDYNPSLNGTWWTDNQVKIMSEPDQVFNYQNGWKVEKYILTDEEIQIPSDPNLDLSIHFR